MSLCGAPRHFAQRPARNPYAFFRLTAHTYALRGAVSAGRAVGAREAAAAAQGAARAGQRASRAHSETQSICQ